MANRDEAALVNMQRQWIDWICSSCNLVPHPSMRLSHTGRRLLSHEPMKALPRHISDVAVLLCCGFCLSLLSIARPVALLSMS